MAQRARKLPTILSAEATEFAKLTAKKRRLNRELVAVTSELLAAEERLTELFISEGVGSIRVRGATVHVRNEVWPALVVPEGMTPEEARVAAVHELELMGHANMVTYNHQSMRSLVRELKDEDGALPPPLGNYIRAEIRHRVGVRGAEED